jgi:hypothetical protein
MCDPRDPHKPPDVWLNPKVQIAVLGSGENKRDEE